MANKEIALQQIHTGLFRNLPDALELGQMALVTDNARVFVGLPSSTNPSSIVAGRNWTNSPNTGKENVEIITEFTPWSVINKLTNKPMKLVAEAATTTSTKIQSTSRVFIEYIAYSSQSTNTVLESGCVQMVYNNNTVIISQQNNTNESEGITQIRFVDPTFNTATKQMQFGVQNLNSDEFVVEFIIRGWDSL